MSGRLAGRTAVVTGAGRGIGRAIVERFLDGGVRVVMTQRLRQEGERACAVSTPVNPVVSPSSQPTAATRPQCRP